jgi:hypothetical protein
MREPPQLSLAAELVWLSLDPNSEGSQGRRLWRLLGTMYAAEHSSSKPRPLLVRRAFRAARDELLAAGCIEPTSRRRKLRLTDRPAAVRRFRTVWEGFAAKDFSTPRDTELALLLAAAGVLAVRLSPDDRRIAARRLRGLDVETHGLKRITSVVPNPSGNSATQMFGATWFAQSEQLLGEAVDSLWATGSTPHGVDTHGGVGHDAGNHGGAHGP